MKDTTALVFSLYVVVAVLASPAQAMGQTGKTFRFLGVGEDPEWAEADRLLLQAIEDQQHDFVFPADPEFRSVPYGDAIDRLVEWAGPGADVQTIPFLARTTPYVFVAAELLGARMKIAAVARAPSDSVTYHSYFVVNKALYRRPNNGEGYSPDIEGVKDYLSGAAQQSKFLYHSRYSTSSYFLPSLFFRDSEIAFGPEAMSTENIDSDSSKELVRRIANQDLGAGHQFAAVWTGTKGHFENAARTQPGTPDANAFDKVLFIQLPTALPNDLLVSRFDVSDDILTELTDGLEESEIGMADVKHWVPIARDAGKRAIGVLADLRMSAREKLAPLTIKISGVGSSTDGVLEAARVAVRQSGGEFALYDEDFHGGSTYEWTIEVQHDNTAVKLVSKVDLFTRPDSQVFHLSYSDVDDLTQRIGAVMRSRLDRVRYLWPYSEDKAIVLRDVDFGLDSADIVWVRKMTVNNARTADFGGVGVDEMVPIRKADLYTFQLDESQVKAITNPDAPEGAGLDLDPMSQSVYRVILVRPEEQPRIFKVLTVVLMLLFGLAFYWAVRFDLMKREWA